MSKDEASGKDGNMFEPRALEVEIARDMAECVAWARQLAEGKQAKAPGQRFVSAITPGRNVITSLCPAAAIIPPQIRAAAEQMAPSATPLNISVIAFTDMEAVMQDMFQAIPFLNNLRILGGIGHNVIIFEGHPSALVAGCQDADMLILDEGMMPYLPANLLEVVAPVMHKRQIFVFGRDGQVLEWRKNE